MRRRHDRRIGHGAGEAVARASPPDVAGHSLSRRTARGDEMALRVFEQQAKAIGRMFSIAANFT